MMDCQECPFLYANCGDEDAAWVNNKEMYSDKFLDLEIEIDTPLKTIPRGKINSKWKWLARDENGNLFAFEKKPTSKGPIAWMDEREDNGDIQLIWPEHSYGNFDNIKWEDEEPTEIED